MKRTAWLLLLVLALAVAGAVLWSMTTDERSDDASASEAVRKLVTAFGEQLNSVSPQGLWDDPAAIVVSFEFAPGF